MRKTPMAFTDQEIADLKTALTSYMVTLLNWKREAEKESSPDAGRDYETDAERIRALYHTVEFFQKGGE